MNKEYYDSINNAINYLNNAIQDITNRKKLIINATNYIEDAIKNSNSVIAKNEVPYISTYHIKPIVKPNEEVIIDYYITDYYHKEYVNEDYSEIFTVTVRVEGRDDIVVRNLKAGDHSISLGTFPKLDGAEQKFSILCTDEYGRNSHELFNFFLVRNDIAIKEYVMTEEDLITYNISNTNDVTKISDTRKGLQALLDDKQAKGYNKLKLLEGTYRIDHTSPIYIPTRFTLDMNGATLKLHEFTGDKAIMMELNNTFDSHVINGVIEGDYYNHDYANSPNNSEWVNGISIGGESKYSSYENLIIKDITGYGTINGIKNSRDGKLGYTYLSPRGIGNTFKLGDIDRNTGMDIESTNRTTCDFRDISGYGDLGYLSVSIYLGYQGNPCGTWNLICHFYDKNKNFIKSTDAYQYRRVAVPNNAKYMRVTILNESYPTNLSIQLFRIPTNCQFKNLKLDNCRAVGMAPQAMNNLLFEYCELTKCGSAVTSCALDAEDGWDMRQDVTFRKFNFHDNPSNEFLTCAGHNFIVEDMIDGNIYIWERTKDFVLRNSNCRNINIGYKDVVRHGISRIYNNTVTGGNVSENIARDMTVKGSLSGTVYNSTMNSIGAGNYYNCEFDISSNFISYIYGIKMDNCIIKPVEDFTGRYSLSFDDYSHSSINRFNDCKFYGKSKLSNHNYFSDGVFNNCYFEDTYIEANVQGNEGEVIQFNNCDINSTNDILVRYSPHNYTVGNYTNVQFNNCNINSDTITTFAYGYAKPTNGVLEINSCNVNMPNLTLLFNCYPQYFENIKDFTIKIVNTDLTCEKILHDNLAKYEGTSIKYILI